MDEYEYVQYLLTFAIFCRNVISQVMGSATRKICYNSQEIIKCLQRFYEYNSQEGIKNGGCILTVTTLTS